MRNRKTNFKNSDFKKMIHGNKFIPNKTWID
jgi:hypothetical protein